METRSPAKYRRCMHASLFSKTRLGVAGALLVVAPLILHAQSAGTHASDHAGASGDEKSTKTRVLEAGAELLQSEGPVGAIHAHVCGFHRYSAEPQRQVRAHHYCSHLNEDVLQCVIYDSAEKNARLIGVEYIISEKLFAELPAEEKQLWHSHRHEVKSGQLIAPRLPDIAEKELMEKLVNTYGKTWHTWQVDRGDRLPLGLPKLMMSFTADGQIDPQLLSKRDREYGIRSADKRDQRADIAAREVAEGADRDGFQLDDRLLKTKASTGKPTP
jgi:hypothetical protein